MLYFSREKSHLDDLRSTIDSTERTSESEESDHQESTIGPAKPKMTARERLRLKKMQEADKRAADLKLVFLVFVYSGGFCLYSNYNTYRCQTAVHKGRFISPSLRLSYNCSQMRQSTKKSLILFLI